MFMFPVPTNVMFLREHYDSDGELMNINDIVREANAPPAPIQAAQSPAPIRAPTPCFTSERFKTLLTMNLEWILFDH